MTYTTIQPPFTLDFRNMPKSELRSYFDWFMKVIPARLGELGTAVRETHADWPGDFSVESLDELGKWFEGQVETRPKTREEVEKVARQLTFPIEVSGDQLTNRTFSLAMDIGLYFAQVILSNLDGTKWDQPLKNEKFADYGQPVIMGFGTVPLNPVRVAVSTAYGIAKGKRAELRELYDTWAGMRRR
jgi:hypothetical protein